jgi:hypothetical protein
LLVRGGACSSGAALGLQQQPCLASPACSLAPSHLPFSHDAVLSILLAEVPHRAACTPTAIQSNQVTKIEAVAGIGLAADIALSHMRGTGHTVGALLAAGATCLVVSLMRRH